MSVNRDGSICSKTASMVTTSKHSSSKGSASPASMSKLRNVIACPGIPVLPSVAVLSRAYFSAKSILVRKRGKIRSLCPECAQTYKKGGSVLRLFWLFFLRGKSPANHCPLLRFDSQQIPHICFPANYFSSYESKLYLKMHHSAQKPSFQLTFLPSLYDLPAYEIPTS